MDDANEASNRQELIDAVRRNDLERVRQLVLYCKVDVKSTSDREFDSALCAACGLNDGEEMVRFLLENGAEDVNSCYCGLYPLYMAIENLGLKTVQVLIHHGADLNLCRAVDYACQCGNLDILQTLISHGGRFEIFNSSVVLCTSPFLSETDRLAMFKCLMDNTKGIEYKKNHRRWTTLHYACQYGRDSIVRLLITRDKGLILTQTEKGLNSLHCTTNIEVAKALLEIPYNEVTGQFGRDPSVIREMLFHRNNCGETPLERMLGRVGLYAYQEDSQEALKDTIEYVRTYFSSLVGESGAVNPDFNPFQQRLATEIRNDLGRVLVDDLVVQIMCYLTPVDVTNRSMGHHEEVTKE